LFHPVSIVHGSTALDHVDLPGALCSLRLTASPDFPIPFLVLSEPFVSTSSISVVFFQILYQYNPFRFQFREVLQPSSILWVDRRVKRWQPIVFTSPLLNSSRSCSSRKLIHVLQNHFVVVLPASPLNALESSLTSQSCLSPLNLTSIDSPCPSVVAKIDRLLRNGGGEHHGCVGANDSSTK
jgi:hypothetical protein